MDLEVIKKKRREQQRQQLAAAAARDQQAQAESLRTAVKETEATTAGAAARTTVAVNKSQEALSQELQNNAKSIVDAMSTQNGGVAEALNNLVVATVMARDPGLLDVVTNFTELLDKLASASSDLKNNPLNELPTVNKQLVKTLQDFSKQESGEPDYTAKFDALESAVKALDIKPVINIPKSDTKLDITPLIDAVNNVQSAVKDNKIKIPSVKFDDVVSGLQAVQDTIANLRFPVPNFILPFKDANGKDVQVQLDSSGNLPVDINVDNVTISENIAQLGGNNINLGAGTTGTGTQRIVIATDQSQIPVGASTATGSAVPANGFYQSGVAKTALPAAATDGNLTGLMADKFGRQVVLIDGIRDISATQTTTISASTAETTIGTAVASTFLDLTSVLISNTSATAVRVDFRDTTSGSVIFSIYVPAGDTRGFVVHTPIPQTTVNTNWTAQSSASVTDLRVFIKFIRNK